MVIASTGTLWSYGGIVQVISGAQFRKQVSSGGYFRCDGRFILTLRLEVDVAFSLPTIGRVRYRNNINVRLGHLGYSVVVPPDRTEASCTFTEVPDADDLGGQLVKSDGTELTENELAQVAGEPGHWESSGKSSKKTSRT